MDGMDPSRLGVFWLLICYLSSAWLVPYFSVLFWGVQAKKSNAELTEVTNKVYFDIEIDGKPAGLW
jgi:hypothetical protein